MDKNKIYPRSNDNQTVYLKSVITRPTIKVGDFTIYNDFVNDPRDFEKNNVLSLAGYEYFIVYYVSRKHKSYRENHLEKSLGPAMCNWEFGV